jgi:hypothetical protein
VSSQLFDRIYCPDVEGWNIVGAAAAIDPRDIVLNAQHDIVDLVVAAGGAAEQLAATSKPLVIGRPAIAGLADDAAFTWVSPHPPPFSRPR